jgi:hypothetical protein
MILKLPSNNLGYAKFWREFQICSVAVPELGVDTENRKAD